MIPEEYRTTVCATTIEVGSSVCRPHGPANQARAEGEGEDGDQPEAGDREYDDREPGRDRHGEAGQEQVPREDERDAPRDAAALVEPVSDAGEGDDERPHHESDREAEQSECGGEGEEAPPSRRTAIVG